jgi:hypothetical protein
MSRRFRAFRLTDHCDPATNHGLGQRKFPPPMEQVSFPQVLVRSTKTEQQGRSCAMHSIIYVIGLIVVVLAVLSLLGLA